jgi:RHS repeat-associated protein
LKYDKCPSVPVFPTETPQSNVYNSQNQVNLLWTYDNNGNVVTIPIVASQSRNFTYDAENRTVSATIVTGTGNISASYVYDGLGERVSKTVNGVTTTYLYDAFGNLAAEYGATQSPCDTSTCYLTVDHLGSTRLLTDSNGSSTVTRYDYEPFGAEITATYGGRTTAMGYAMAPDTMGPKYTGKYRDQETTIDWFEVRHLSGAQGRFQSVDPGNAGADPSDPQTWNGYAYVGNNPLSYTDPSGMYAAAGGGDGGGVFGAIAGLIVNGFEDLINSFRGGSGPPALANFPFPNQTPTFYASVWDTTSLSSSTAPIFIPGLMFFAQATSSTPKERAPNNCAQSPWYSVKVLRSSSPGTRCCKEGFDEEGMQCVLRRTGCPNFGRYHIPLLGYERSDNRSGDHRS